MLKRASQLIEAGIAAGHHPGAQLYVSEHGSPVVDAAFGESEPGVPLRPDHLTLWLSCTKPLTAIAVAREWEADRIDLHAPVATYVPEFAEGGKEDITVWHALTHTGGFRAADVGWKPRPWDESVARIAAARKEPRWTPGEKAGYHVDASWYLLGEIVARTSGQGYAEYLREHILLPMGMTDSWVGIAPDRLDEYRDRIAGVWDTSGESPEEITLYRQDRVLSLCRPGGNGRGPARELGRFYEALLDGGAGVVHPATIAEFTRPHRIGLHDHSFGHDLDWGLGFIVDNKHYGPESVPYGFGHHASAGTFGHGGNRSSMAFADPENGLVVVAVFNGLADEAVHQPRMRQLLDAIYEELSLA